jgi:hypothetical protein
MLVASLGFFECLSMRVSRPRYGLGNGVQVVASNHQCGRSDLNHFWPTGKLRSRSGRTAPKPCAGEHSPVKEKNAEQEKTIDLRQSIEVLRAKMEKKDLEIQCTNHKAWGIGKTNIARFPPARR